MFINIIIIMTFVNCISLLLSRSGDSENITVMIFSENTITIVKLSRYLTFLVQHVIHWNYFKFSAKNTNTC